MAASKKPFPFAGKEGKKEEKAEKKFGKAAYAKGEKKEGEKGIPKFKCGGVVGKKK